MSNQTKEENNLYKLLVRTGHSEKTARAILAFYLEA
jgi:hypothetical protein